jgi:hypothetical protein
MPPLRNPASWAISFRPNGAHSLLRLNIAQWRAVDLCNEEGVPEVGVEFFGERLTRADRRSLKSFGARFWKDPVRLPGLQYARLPVSKLKQVSNALLKPHKAFIDTALDNRHGKSSWWRSHSVAVVRVLREVLRTDLPQPSYVKLGPATEEDLSSTEVVFDREVEKYLTESALVPSAQEPYRALRSEARLLTKYVDYLRRRHARVGGKSIRIKGEKGDIRCDLYNASRKQLIEAKASTARGAIRLAIGELADYRRYLDEDVRCAVLLPDRPSEDLLDLLSTQGIAVVWREGKSSFSDNAGGDFV